MKQNLSEIIELIGKKILIKEDSFDDSTKTGLKFIKKDENKTIGEVLLNNKLTDDYLLGDRVVYPKFAGVNVEIDDEKYKTLETREIFFTYNNGKITAKNNFIVVKPIIKSETRKLKLVKSQDESNTNGIIVSVADGVDLQVGSEAVFSRFSGFSVNMNGDNHTVLAEEEIFFIIKPK